MDEVDKQAVLDWWNAKSPKRADDVTFDEDEWIFDFWNGKQHLGSINADEIFKIIEDD